MFNCVVSNWRNNEWENNSNKIGNITARTESWKRMTSLTKMKILKKPHQIWSNILKFFKWFEGRPSLTISGKLQFLQLVRSLRKPLNFRCEGIKIAQPLFTYSKSTMETPEQCVKSVQSWQYRYRRCRPGVFIINSEQISLSILGFPLLTLNN